MEPSVQPAAPVDPAPQSADPAAGAAPAAQAPAPTPPAEPNAEATASALDDLPEWARAEIKNLRGENAQRRTTSNELKAQLDAAKSQEDIDAAVAAANAKVTELERSLSIATHTAGLPAEAAELVTGTTDEEIKASADKVRALLAGATPAKEPDLNASGGLNPKGTRGDVGGYDPGALAAEILAKRRH